MAEALLGRVAVVTGAGAGLGRAIVERFVAEGASVVVLEVSPQRAQGIEADFPGAVTSVVGDATRLVENVRAVEMAVDKYGHLDTFIANAGYWDFGVTVEELPNDHRLDEAFDQIFALNVKAMIYGAKAAVPALRLSRGSIILTGSNASFHPGGGGVLYTASKHAVVGLVRQLAYELAPEIRVNGVAPGGMVTELAPPPSLGTAAKGIAELPMKELISAVSPLAFLPDPADYVGWYVTLASATDARTITGETIECGGGESVRGKAFSAYARTLTGDPRAAVDP